MQRRCFGRVGIVYGVGWSLQGVGTYIWREIRLVERYGHGLDRIFKQSIIEGKGTPNIHETQARSVQLTIPTQVKDKRFVIFLEKISKEKQITFDFVKDLVFLDEIRVNQNSKDQNRKEKFLNLGILEKSGKGRGTKYFLSRTFYDFIESQGEYIRKKWLSKEQQKEVLLRFFKEHKKGRMEDFREGLFDGKLNNKQILKLLNLLRDEGYVYFDGKPKSNIAYWRLEVKG